MRSFTNGICTTQKSLKLWEVCYPVIVPPSLGKSTSLLLFWANRSNITAIISLTHYKRKNDIDHNCPQLSLTWQIADFSESGHQREEIDSNETKANIR